VISSKKISSRKKQLNNKQRPKLGDLNCNIFWKFMLILKDVGSFVGAVALCGFVGPELHGALQ